MRSARNCRIWPAGIVLNIPPIQIRHYTSVGASKISPLLDIRDRYYFHIQILCGPLYDETDTSRPGIGILKRKGVRKGKGANLWLTK